MQINKLITHNKFLITDPSLGVQHISTIWQEEMCSPDTTKGKERTQYQHMNHRKTVLKLRTIPSHLA